MGIKTFLHDMRFDEVCEALGVGKLLRQSRDTAKNVRSILRKVDQIMATLAELSQKFDGLSADVRRLAEDYREALDRLNTDELSPANQAVVDDLYAKTDALDAAVEVVSPEPTAPVEDVPADETPVEPGA